MKFFIVYESVFGNTRRIATAVEHGLRALAQTEMGSVEHTSPHAAAGYDVLVIGGPTHAFSMSTPSSRHDAIGWTQDGKHDLELDAGEPTTGIREWIADADSLPPAFAAFDTRVDGMRRLPGSAARRLTKRLRARGLTPLAPPTSFYVSSASELLDGEETRAEAWGASLADTLVRFDARARTDRSPATPARSGRGRTS